MCQTEVGLLSFILAYMKVLGWVKGWLQMFQELQSSHFSSSLRTKKGKKVIRCIHHNNYVTASISNSTVIVGTDHHEITWLGCKSFTNYICKSCEVLCPLHAKSHVLGVLSCVPMETNTSFWDSEVTGWPQLIEHSLWYFVDDSSNDIHQFMHLQLELQNTGLHVVFILKISL